MNIHTTRWQHNHRQPHGTMLWTEKYQRDFTQMSCSSDFDSNYYEFPWSSWRCCVSKVSWNWPRPKVAYEHTKGMSVVRTSLSVVVYNRVRLESKRYAIFGASNWCEVCFHGLKHSCTQAYIDGWKAGLDTYDRESIIELQFTTHLLGRCICCKG